MKIPIYIVIIVAIFLIFIFYQKEPFTATNYAAIGSSIRDLVDNNLNIFQYRAKYGNTVSPLRVNYLVSAYKSKQMTNQKVSEIMNL